MLINPLIIAARILDENYAKDPNPDNWRTINGAKVHVDGNGNADGGAGGKFNGNKFGEDWRSGQRSALLQAAGVFKPKEKPLKGSEKQVKWARDIIAGARATIDINIEKDKKELARVGYVDTLVNSIKAWEQLKESYEKVLDKIDDARFVIDKRNHLDSSAMVAKFNELLRRIEYKKEKNQSPNRYK